MREQLPCCTSVKNSKTTCQLWLQHPQQESQWAQKRFNRYIDPQGIAPASSLNLFMDITV
eukprot:2015723-Amphidinium_carterae.1